MTHVAARPRVLSCFSGVAGLDLAFRCVVPDARTVCYVEREVPAVAVLAARMADGSIDAAPVWSDVRTVPAVVQADWCIGGFPCQDISGAGKREGINGARSGLWFAMLDAAHRAGCRYLFVENVRRLVLDGVDAVLGSLADRGWDAEWLCVRAADVGAPHGRDRWFGLAWRLDDAERGERERELASGRRSRRRGAASRRSDGVAHAEGHLGRGELAESGARFGWAGPSGDGGSVADAVGGRSRDERGVGVEAGREPRAGGEVLADAPSRRERERLGVGATSGDGSEPGLEGHGEVVANPDRGGRVELCERDEREGRAGAEREGGSIQRDLLGDAGGRHAHVAQDGIFPPGPGSWADAGGGRFVPLDRDAARWVALLGERPDLAPAVEPAVRGEAHGLARRVDRLRACGNGVVVVQGALALVELLRRAGLTW